MFGGDDVYVGLCVCFCERGGCVFKLLVEIIFEMSFRFLFFRI